jgi:hypothetical protein
LLITNTKLTTAKYMPTNFHDISQVILKNRLKETREITQGVYFFRVTNLTVHEK